MSAARRLQVAAVLDEARDSDRADETTGVAARRRPAGPMAVVTISALCEATGTSSRAIRHYEDVGLLSPQRSRGNGRLFSPEDLDKAALIVFLRRFGLPIDALRPLIDPDRPEADRLDGIRQALHSKAVEMEARVRDLRSALVELDRAGRTTLPRFRPGLQGTGDR